MPYPTIQKGPPHPAVFPVKLFMGIGNTALACVRHKINYVGTEIDPRYIAIAMKQISEGIDTYL